MNKNTFPNIIKLTQIWEIIQICSFLIILGVQLISQHAFVTDSCGINKIILGETIMVIICLFSNISILCNFKLYERKEKDQQQHKEGFHRCHLAFFIIKMLISIIYIIILFTSWVDTVKTECP